eukprot:Pompholyxophrys_punicea_v1_NODE_235_length_2617_cov_4.682279.p3 type:complete len:119 gc:universal NODE_235_length_2617_cov_4.682279:1198-1554(+)
MDEEIFMVGVRSALQQMKRTELKARQLEVLHIFFFENCHLFIVLPCGYGKTLIFLLVPLIFDYMFPSTQKSFILIISPLRMLMKSHVRSLENTDLQAIYFGGTRHGYSLYQDCLQFPI